MKTIPLTQGKVAVVDDDDHDFLMQWKWRARIKVNGKEHSLGYYVSEEDAAQAYDDAASHYFGEYARPNFSRGA
jgi:hypothetical protein